MTHAESVRSYAFAVDDRGRLVDGMTDDGEPRQHYTVEQAGARVRELAHELAEERGISFSDALHRVVRNPENATLAAVYTGTRLSSSLAPKSVSRREASGQVIYSAGREASQRAHAYAEKHKVDFSTALRAVLDADGELKRKYVSGG